MTKEQLEEKLAKALKKQAKLGNEIEEITQQLEEMETEDEDEATRLFLTSKGFTSDDGYFYSRTEGTLFLEAYSGGEIQIYFGEQCIEAEENTILESVETIKQTLHAQKKCVDEALVAFDKVFGEKQQ